ncbi:MAG: hypothetical protein AB7S41_11285 [Parvibaculaceae bacterium]
MTRAPRVSRDENGQYRYATPADEALARKLKAEKDEQTEIDHEARARWEARQEQRRQKAQSEADLKEQDERAELHRDMAQRATSGAFMRELETAFLARSMTIHAVSFAIAAVTVVISVYVGSSRYESFLRRLFDNWSILSFLGLETLIYFALRCALTLFRR